MNYTSIVNSNLKDRILINGTSSLNNIELITLLIGQCKSVKPSVLVAEDLLKSVPLIEAAIMGGKVEGSILESMKFWKDNKDKEFAGLASDDINFEKASTNIKMLRKALGFQDNPGQRMTANALGKSAAGQRGNNFQDNSTTAFDNSQKNLNAIFTATPLENDSLAGKIAKS